MTVERCDECGFDGDNWTESGALEAIGELPSRWKQAVVDLDPGLCRIRPFPDRWSIAEYVDHVREVLFGMRFVVDSAVAQPGIDLGESPESVFEPEPRDVDPHVALGRVEHEALSLQSRLAEISPDAWYDAAIIGGEEVDVRWICRHAVHDATHHLMDVERLRIALPGGRGSVT